MSTASDIGFIAIEAAKFIPQPEAGVLTFLGEHADAIGALIDAIKLGVDKGSLTDFIEQSMKAVSDAQMKAELK